ncbi:hypothetical protein [Campylobacter sp.]|uniref:hypothetical protein n=1 Tax=Campylobacter sp. TaxID=205 RepID=UPI002AA7DEF3|nr:hypothetical protein [Campylobacter sp.]MCI6565607.1 hypothetical protein [Campylobacter sp.]MCI6579625.1 hypothetical protein [Campylobacter sp.]MCI7014707.1 hypothetical protein [Campylobacter sp.]
MKYFVRILAFLFISFSFGFCKGLHPIKELLYYTNEITSYSDISSLGVNTDKKNISNVGTIFIPLSYFKYFFKSPIDGRLFYLYVRDYESKLDHIFYQLDSTSTSITFYYFKNPVLKFQYKNSEDIAVTYVDSLEKSCEITLFGKGTFNGFFCVRKGYDVPCLNPDYYFSEKLGKCIPKCVNPENGDKGYYNDEKGRCEFCSFGATFDEETQTCSNWKCFQLENKMERFDCLCREGGHGAGVSVKTFVTGAGTDCSITCEDGLRISTISNFNVFKQLFDTVFNGGYVQTTFSNPTKFCTVDNSTNIDLVDPSDSKAEKAGSQSAEQSSEQGGEQGGEQSSSQSSEQGGEKAGSQDGEQSSEQGSSQSSEQGGEKAGSQDGEQGGFSKGTISIKDPVTGKEEVVEIGKNKKENSISYRDPETGNQVEIKPKDKTGGNTITITDTITGEKKTVEIGKNDNKKNEISYKDPYTGKDVVIDLSPKGKRGDSQGEAKGQGKVDKKGEGDFEFKGPNLGGLGNPEDFDKGLELLSLSNKLSNLENEGEGIFNRLLNDSKGMIADAKGSLDGIVDTAKQLSKNPITYNSVSSCPIGFSLLDQQHTIDLCKVLSRFDHLFYALFFVFLNMAVFFVALRIMMLAIVGFTNL